MIDLEDFEKVNSYKGTWCVSYEKCGNNYYCNINYALDIGKRKILQLHRIIMNVTNSKIKVDHIYHNTLDNRKSQLRVITHQENCFNTNAKGYSWHKKAQKYRAQICIDGKRKYLGLFNTEEEARGLYLEAKEYYHGIEKKKSKEEITEFEKFIKEEPKGYYWHKIAKKWCSIIKVNGERKYLGLFKTEEEASQAYLKAKEVQYN